MIIPSAYLLQLFRLVLWGDIFPDAAMLLSTSLFLVFGSMFSGVLYLGAGEILLIFFLLLLHCAGRRWLTYCIKIRMDKGGGV